MTLEQLQVAKWNKLFKGIDYISVKTITPNSVKYDSIEITPKEITGDSHDSTGLDFDAIYPYVKTTLTEFLKSDLPHSKKGYFRVNFYELRQTRPFMASIYMRDGYDSLHFASDIVIFQKIPLITEAKYISKETAELQYLADGNPDWKNVLDENPLPISIQLVLDAAKCSVQSVQDLKKIILDKIPFATDVTTPIELLKRYENLKDKNYFFEYQRK